MCISLDIDTLLNAAEQQAEELKVKNEELELQVITLKNEIKEKKNRLSNAIFTAAEAGAAPEVIKNRTEKARSKINELENKLTTIQSEIKENKRQLKSKDISEPILDFRFGDDIDFKILAQKYIKKAEAQAIMIDGKKHHELVVTDIANRKQVFVYYPLRGRNANKYNTIYWVLSSNDKIIIERKDIKPNVPHFKKIEEYYNQKTRV